MDRNDDLLIAKLMQADADMANAHNKLRKLKEEYVDKFSEYHKGGIVRFNGSNGIRLAHINSVSLNLHGMTFSYGLFTITKDGNMSKRQSYAVTVTEDKIIEKVDGIIFKGYNSLYRD